MPPVYLPMKRTFFQTSEPRWMILITSGLAMLLWSWLSPTTIPGPYGVYLGPLGLLGRFLGTSCPTVVAGLVYMAAFLHVAEAMFAVKICRDHRLSIPTTLKWFGQTLLFGVASLSILWERSKAAKRS